MEYIGRRSASVLAGQLYDIKVHSLEFIDTIYISRLNDFFGDVYILPEEKKITLEANKTYFITNNVNLQDYYLYAPSKCCILGYSSEVSSLTSTADTMLIVDDTLPIRDITLINNTGTILDIDGSRSGSSNIAYDWYGVNFTGEVGIIKNFDNFVASSLAFLNGYNLTFDGTSNTIAISNSLFSPGSGNNMIIIPATANISRRFRIIYSSFVIIGIGIGINFNNSATVPTESYILDTCNFSGGGSYLSGINYTSNLTLFVNNVGITNTSVNGQLYMNNNLDATSISDTTNFFKVAGTTTNSPDNSKYTGTDNRLTCQAIIERTYLIQCNLSFNAGSNNVCEFGFYDSAIGSVRLPSRTKGTANSGGRAENISFMCVVKHSANDYLEIHCRNTSAITNITVSDMNFVITEIN